jgi:hypothetical protein
MTHAPESDTDDGLDDKTIGRSSRFAEATMDGFVETTDAMASFVNEPVDYGAVLWFAWYRLAEELIAIGWTAEGLARDASKITVEEAEEAAEDRVGTPVGYA